MIPECLLMFKEIYKQCTSQVSLNLQNLLQLLDSSQHYTTHYM